MDPSLPLPPAVHRPTIKDIARECRLGISTVARALNHEAHCASQTREAVLAAAKKLGYQKNRAAAILGATSKITPHPIAQKVALITDVPPSRPEKVLATAITPFKKALDRTGRTGETFPLTSSAQIPGALKTAYARGCDGIILEWKGPPPDWHSVAQWDRFAIVAVDNNSEGAPFHRIQRAHFDETRRLLLQLLQSSSGLVAVLIPEHPFVCIADRDRSAAVLMTAQDFPPHRMAICPNLSFHSLNRKKVQQWLARKRPRAVLGFGGFFWWDCYEAGLPMLGGCRFAALNGGGWSFSHPDTGEIVTIGGYDEEQGEMEAHAFQLLDSLLAHSQTGIPSRHRMVLSLELEYLPGNSC